MMTLRAFIELVARMRSYQTSRPQALAEQSRHGAIRECLERQVDAEIAEARAAELRVVSAEESEAMRRGVSLEGIDDAS